MGSPVTGVTDGDVCCKSNPGPLQEQVLSTMEQAQLGVFNIFILITFIYLCLDIWRGGSKAATEHMLGSEDTL